MQYPAHFISLADLYVAYRKAKREAFSETNCAHGLKFSRFERDLDANLRFLRIRLNRSVDAWHEDPAYLGRPTCIPKAVSAADCDITHLNVSDAFADWKRRHAPGKPKAKTEFRVVIDATVEFQVISALWIIKVGHKYDASLNDEHAVGNRLRRWRPKEDAPAGQAGALNLRSHFLFRSYFQAYGSWRRKGLNSMKEELTADREIVAVTMDLRRFYHQVDAAFLLETEYLKIAGIALSRLEIRFTKEFIQAITTWNKAAEKQFLEKQRGLPVGLSASSVIANVLLKEFDSRLVQELDPVYYGRYVDDIFLVLRYGHKFETSSELMRWLAKRLSPIARYDEEKDEAGVISPVLRISFKYAKGSDLMFVGKKQKVFQLEGKSGLDLIAPIEEQIRRQRSEHRELPSIPDSEAEMAARALLVTSDATLDADALRKADVATLRRAGFALLLGAVERHSRDLDRSEPAWRVLRTNFYGLAERHLLTPTGFFDFLRYFPKVLELMVACDDLAAARRFAKKLGRLITLIRATCVVENRKMIACCSTLSSRTVEAVLKAQPAHGRRKSLLPLFQILRSVVSRLYKYPITGRAIGNLGEQLFLSDWSRRRYSQTWIESNLPKNPFPKKPQNSSIRKILHLHAIETLQKFAHLAKPQWPALAFPTRPLTIAEITGYAPKLLGEYDALREIISGLRGAWMPQTTDLRVIEKRNYRPQQLIVPAALEKDVRIAVTNFEISDREWIAAAKGSPLLSLARYRRVNSLINQIIRQYPKPTYVVLPECSLPRRWARNVALALSFQGISLIAGLEYRRKRGGLRNEALVSLVSDFPNYKNNICVLQTKLAPAWHEKELLEKVGAKLEEPSDEELQLPVYVHDRFCFGVLICSDLTTLANRNHLQGHVDCVFIPEWNQDLETFATLMESSAHDMHAYMVQANNRQFGDSRIRAPYKLGYRRDVVRVRGGLHDYFVIGQIDHKSLRKFQRNDVPPNGKKEKYKPFPIGFKMSSRRALSR